VSAGFHRPLEDSWLAASLRRRGGKVQGISDERDCAEIPRSLELLWEAQSWQSHAGQREVLRRVGLVDADIDSTTTDSGSNVRKSESEVVDPSASRADHALNLARRRALLAAGEYFAHRSERTTRGWPGAPLRLMNFPNPAAFELFARLLETGTFFEHSDSRRGR